MICCTDFLLYAGKQRLRTKQTFECSKLIESSRLSKHLVPRIFRFRFPKRQELSSHWTLQTSVSVNSFQLSHIRPPPKWSGFCSALSRLMTRAKLTFLFGEGRHRFALPFLFISCTFWNNIDTFIGKIITAQTMTHKKHRELGDVFVPVTTATHCM